tara:strand:- start:711 stop:1484 length:774 start_codon:yes stop_codon:yes gene_type:complete
MAKSGRVAGKIIPIEDSNSTKFMKNKNRRASELTEYGIDTVILDMDGTILDLHFDQEVWNRQLPKQFAITTGRTIESAKIEVAKLMGSSNRTLEWYSLNHWNEVLGIDLAALEVEFSHLVRPRPGAVAFLEMLSESELRVILATNAEPSSMQRKFDITGINRYFDAIGCSHDYGICKEDPAFWPMFTDKLNIDPSKTLLIDDDHNVLRTAMAFGIAYVYGVRRPSSQGPELASNDFHCLAEFNGLHQAVQDDYKKSR